MPRSRPVEDQPDDDTPATPAPRRRWWRRPPGLVGLGVLAVLVAGLLWVVVTGLLARHQLEAARSEVATLKTDLGRGDLPAATLDSRLEQIAGHARDAHQLTTGPAWAVTAALPWVGGPAATLRGLTSSGADLATTTLPALGRVADRVADGGFRDGGSIDLTALDALAPDVHTAREGLARAQDHIGELDDHTWLPPLNRATADLSSQIGGLVGTFASADTALDVLPRLLGSQTEQRYFVAFQNNAEARGTGGLPGAFAIVTADHGTVSFERFESDDTLLEPLVDVAGSVDFGDEQKDYLAQYAYDLPFGDYRDSNESPHFPYAAQIWAAMWQKVSGEQVTGAIAVDPTALSYLLRAAGPVTLTDGTRLNADTIVAATQQQVYAKFPGLDNTSIAERKDYLLDVASQTEKALLGPGTVTARLVSGAAEAADERRLLVWSSDPDVESVLEGTAVGGALPETSQPFGLLTVLNVSGTKLDYYLDRTLRWSRTGCGDTRDVTVTITVTNTAPATGLPPYVTYRADDPPASVPVGSNRDVLDYFATDGALLKSASVDGKPADVQVYSQRGHPVFRTLLETGPGQSHTYVLHLREPAGSDPVTLLAQPLVRPISQSASDTGC